MPNVLLSFPRRLNQCEATLMSFLWLKLINVKTAETKINIVDVSLVICSLIPSSSSSQYNKRQLLLMSIYKWSLIFCLLCPFLAFAVNDKCQKMNAGCSSFCLPTNDTRVYVCECSDGDTLSEDLLTCAGDKHRE